MIALPFLLQRTAETDQWESGDPTLVIITPHNEAIRYEFARGFSRWHQERYGTPVRIEWREIGGTSEIASYLTAEYVTAFRAWYTRSRQALASRRQLGCRANQLSTRRIRPSVKPP